MMLRGLMILKICLTFVASLRAVASQICSGIQRRSELWMTRLGGLLRKVSAKSSRECLLYSRVSQGSRFVVKWIYPSCANLMGKWIVTPLKILNIVSGILPGTHGGR